MIDMNKKYETKYGKPVQRILCIDGPNKEFPIVIVVVDTVCEVEEDYLVEVSPYKDWKINDPIWIGDYQGVYYPAHFAGITEDGEVKAWNNGGTSHSVTGTFVWKYATKENPND